MTEQLAFYFDSSACTACKACMSACKDKNDLPVGVNYRRVMEYGGGSWVPHSDYPEIMVPNNVYSYAISTACMHCSNPLCMDACPAQAIFKRSDGVVWIDEDKCIGCRYCEWACPYSGPQYDETKDVMVKCDFCMDLLAAGQNPACVDACVMRAIDFGSMEELQEKYGTVTSIEPWPDPEITEPCIVITPHKHAQRCGEGTGEIISASEVLQ